jgi:hypothetical protein
MKFTYEYPEEGEPLPDTTTVYERIEKAPRVGDFVHFDWPGRTVFRVREIAQMRDEGGRLESVRVVLR